MRDRLVATFVGLTLLVLGLFAVAASYVVADVVQDQERERADRTAALVAAAVGARLASGATVDERYFASLLRDGERVVYRTPAGERITAGTVTVEGPRSVRAVDGGGSVTLSLSGRSMADRVSAGVLPLILLSLALAAVAGAVAVVMARRFARPFGELSVVAAAIGAGRFDTPVPHYRVREADELGRALRDTGRRLDVLLERERSLAVNASHELRTPLTALRLSLEDLTLWKHVPTEVVEELTRAIAEVDRLEAAVSGLLEERRDGAHGDEVDVDLAELTSTVAERWRGELDGQGRTVLLEATGPVPTRLDEAVARRVVDALLAHASTHGAGTVTIDVSDRGTVLRVRVSDQGERRVPSGVLHGDDPVVLHLGLAEAALTAESVGGYLTVQDTPHSALLLILPRRSTGA